MNLLLDSHTFLWAGDKVERLHKHVQAALVEPENTVYLSVVSIWEMNIKAGLGKLRLPPLLETDFEKGLLATGFKLLPIEVQHAVHTRSLPLHHRDPFDRMLVAQCLVEDLTLVSKDEQLDAYGIRRLW